MEYRLLKTNYDFIIYKDPQQRISCLIHIILHMFALYILLTIEIIQCHK